MSEEEMLKLVGKQKSTNHPRYRLARFKYAINLIDKKHNNVVLDIGCGLAPASYLLPEDNKIILVDNFSNVGLNSKNYPKKTKNIDLNKKLPFPDKYTDIVLALGVLEHIVNLHSLLDEIYRVLKKDGLFIGCVPNMCSLSARIKWFLGKLPRYSAEVVEADRDRHISDWTFKKVEAVLTQHGFQVETSDFGLWHGETLLIPKGFIKKTFTDRIFFKAWKK